MDSYSAAQVQQSSNQSTELLLEAAVCLLLPDSGADDDLRGGTSQEVC